MDPLSLISAALPLAKLAGEGIASLFSDDAADQKTGGAVAQAVVSAASTIAGVAVTPENAASVAAQIGADPAKLLEFTRSVNEAVVALVKADNDDRASARSQTVDLAKTGSPIAWGAPVVSAIVVVGFFVVMVRLFGLGADDMPERVFNLLNMLFGALVLGFGQVCNYWLGSSSSSRAKDDLIRTIGGAR